MDKLKDLRNQIDSLDEEIMAKIAARLKLMPLVKQEKNRLGLAVTDEKREQEILAKTKQFEHPEAIGAIYTEIIRQSKAVQSSTGLVGKRLSYSYSLKIHQAFGNPDYRLWETDDLGNFIANRQLTGVNITIPYKVQATKFAQSLSPIVRKTKITNVLTWENGELRADNVDYLAFLEMTDYFQIGFCNEKVLILGNGATAQTVYWAVKDRGAQTVQKLGRTIHEETDDLLSNIAKYRDFTVIVNTIPFGVHPELQTEFLVSFDSFSCPKVFIDVNYNPYRSAFLQAGGKLKSIFPNLKLINGLYMLVAGGRLTEEIWQKQAIVFPKTLDVAKKIHFQQINIVLIGLPFSGKTTLGKALAYTLNKTFYDSDEILEQNKQSIHDLPTIEAFREHEREVIAMLAQKQNSVIATGGGVVENEENIVRLAQNGIIVLLKIPFDLLSGRIDETRPLADTKEKLQALAQKREKMYRKFADIVIENPHNILKETVDKINEYLNHQWAES
ncbi:MAG TPA: shikimate kinase [Bacilli bacterium]|jgi:shikimate dehydrogenase|nr:MAG: Shikimate kinase 1 [Tenericutes bacterium ADurb.Bin140]HOE78043.1 shikimate kinase [Bacilli bacterium]HOR95953.1 shikimate kinase [Bacilli bacterium]HPD12936.1 shikimate kinase [Bacilli bacterium]HPK59254.1 shikimate kinase [Bacilli bacterium]